MLSGFPRLQDGFPFYVAPLVAGLDSSQQRAVIDSNDSGWIHAYEPGGGEAPGFPKFTGQWPSFSGVVGDPRFDGNLRLAYGTREGALFVWRVKGDPAHNDSWWHYHHDEHNSGQFGNDTRRPPRRSPPNPPGANGVTLHWTAPGDDGVTGGPVKSYQVYISRHPITLGNLGKHVKPPPPAQPGHTQELTINAGSTGVRFTSRCGRSTTPATSRR